MMQSTRPLYDTGLLPRCDLEVEHISLHAPVMDLLAFFTCTRLMPSWISIRRSYGAPLTTGKRSRHDVAASSQLCSRHEFSNIPKLCSAFHGVA